MDRTLRRSAALAALRERWGSAAPRPASEVFGALAVAPAPRGIPALPAGPAIVPAPGTAPAGPAIVPAPGTAPPRPSFPPRPSLPDAAGRVVSTGFPELDALLGPGGLPRPGSVALAGTGSAGTTTLALRAVASAQAAGALAAWVDGSHSLDPVEAVARGVRLEWLVVLVPCDPAEGLEMAGTLLQARAVDILVLDPGDGRAPARDGAPASPSGQAGSPAGDVVLEGGAAPTRGIMPGQVTAGHWPLPGHQPLAGHQPLPGHQPPSVRLPSLADRLDRVLALARRAGALLVVLEPTDLPDGLHGVLDGAGLRLELRRRGWIRLGREVVGQRTEVLVARDHHGAPGRRTELRILYAEGGSRDRCLRRRELLDEASADAPAPPRLATPPRPPRVLA